MIAHLKDDRLRLLCLWLLSSTVLAFAITRQSLWMDEGYTAWFASHKSMASFLPALLGTPGAPGDPQMLFYLLYMWAWVKLWGTSEIALRAANLPFAILLVTALYWASSVLFRRSRAWLLLCLSPFAWFYLNEARPYMAIMALSAVAIVSALAYFMDYARSRVVAPWCCLSALLLAWGAHILAALLVPSLLIMIVAMTKSDLGPRKNILRDWSPALLVLLPAFIGLGAFYLWTSSFGINMKRAEPGVANLGFVFYEFIGLAGLGPPRNQLREHPHVQAFAGYWPWLLVGIVALLSVGYTVQTTLRNKVSRILALSLLAGLAIALIVAKVAHFQLLGRHVAVLFPLFFVFFLSCKESGKQSRGSRYLSVAAMTALGIAWGVSDLRLVLLPQYEKDSYRAASALSVMRAKALDGEILWAADPHTACYYGLQIATHASAEPTSSEICSGLTWPIHGQALDAGNWTVEEVASYLHHRTRAVIFVLSRPDLYDKDAGWRVVIEQQKPTVVAQLSEFQLYEWPAASETAAAQVHPANQQPTLSSSRELGWHDPR